MLFITPEDFFEKVKAISPLDRETELALAQRMQAGDPDAREALIRGYLPHVAAVIRRRNRLQTLEGILRCYIALEQAVDRFDFLQEHDTFSHYLSWVMRQTATRYLADVYTRDVSTP